MSIYIYIFQKASGLCIVLHWLYLENDKFAHGKYKISLTPIIVTVFHDINIL